MAYRNWQDANPKFYDTSYVHIDYANYIPCRDTIQAWDKSHQDHEKYFPWGYRDILVMDRKSFQELKRSHA